MVCVINILLTWLRSDENTFEDNWSDDDYFLNEFEIFSSQEMDNEFEGDGGYDDDTDADDVVILDGPGDDGEEGDANEDDDADQETENEADEDGEDQDAEPPPRKVARMGNK